MLRRIARQVRPGLLATGFLLALAAPAPPLVGPPWISIEYPPNPMDPSTRGAFLLVHTFHHQQVTRELVSGTAEGIVNGERRTIELDFDRTSRPGVLALKKMWPSEGNWLLVIAVGRAEGGATALVSIGTNGQVASVRVPTTRYEGGRFEGPRRVTAQEIEETLRAQAQLSRATE